MEKIVGYVTSKISSKRYSVKWITDDHSSWINTNINIREKVCTNIFIESDAISCVQNFIDSQPDIY